MTADGRCPSCRTEIVFTTVSGKPVTADSLDLRQLAGEKGEKVPWHFTLLVALLCLYMGWRIIQLFV
ncbi:MAG: hypothetical protein ACO36A_01555 [Ilumatobacteraceae bacterium]